MSRKGPRRLRPEEEELWQKVIDRTSRMHPEKRSDQVSVQALIPPKAAATPTPKLNRFRVGEAAKAQTPGHDIAPSLGERLARQPVAMDHKRFGQMKKGRLAPEARIDLHGMTLAEAHPALTGFILRAAAEGRRLVLVITGKGKSKPDHGPIPERHGALRHQVPHWLHSAPLKAHVLQISEAHLKHGGQGAYYIYLRRPRQGMNPPT